VEHLALIGPAVEALEVVEDLPCRGHARRRVGVEGEIGAVDVAEKEPVVLGERRTRPGHRFARQRCQVLHCLIEQCNRLGAFRLHGHAPAICECRHAESLFRFAC